MAMWKYVVCLFSVMALVACSDDSGLLKEEASQIVVEGWIEDDGFPVVILTRTLPVSTDHRAMEDLKDYLIRWAKVTVSDGTESVVLTGKYDKGYFPPYIYTTGNMRGKAGKSYSLTVEYRDYYATAQTTIPSKPYYCTFKVERCADSDTLYQIKATFKDNPSEKNYYQFFIRVGTSTKQYLASYLGCYDDATLGSITEVPVFQGHQLTFDYTPYYRMNDSVTVKFAHIDETSFRIWDSYTKLLSLSSNMFLSSSTDMETNITGGYGYWCGYAAITKYITINDSIGK